MRTAAHTFHGGDVGRCKAIDAAVASDARVLPGGSDDPLCHGDQLADRAAQGERIVFDDLCPEVALGEGEVFVAAVVVDLRVPAEVDVFELPVREPGRLSVAGEDRNPDRGGGGLGAGV